MGLNEIPPKEGLGGKHSKLHSSNLWLIESGILDSDFTIEFSPSKARLAADSARLSTGFCMARL